MPFGQFLRTSSWLPPMPPLATITAGARRSNSPTRSRLLARAALGVVGREHAAAHPDDGSVLDDERGHLVPESQVDQPGGDALAQFRLERLRRRRGRFPR